MVLLTQRKRTTPNALHPIIAAQHAQALINDVLLKAGGSHKRLARNFFAHGMQITGCVQYKLGARDFLGSMAHARISLMMTSTTSV